MARLIDPPIPEYRRVAAFLQEGVRSGHWDEDEALPTDQELAERFNVSRQTVRRAYLDLVHEELVYRVPGRGTFIMPRDKGYNRTVETIDDLISLSDDTEFEMLQGLEGGWDATAGERLQLESRLLYVMKLARIHKGNVFCHTTIYLPPKTGRLLENVPSYSTVGAKSDCTVIGSLANRGIQISGAEQLITARAADEVDAELLGCPVNHPLLHIERLYVDSSGEPVEFAVSSFLPEHYTHRLHLGRRARVQAEQDSPVAVEN